jgi:hypothetical protein
VSAETDLVKVRVELLERLLRRGLDETDIKLTDSGHDFVVSLDLMQRLQPRAEGREARHDQLTGLEALLLRAFYAVADACSELPNGVLEILADEEWSEDDCGQIERLLEEERADRA